MLQPVVLFSVLCKAFSSLKRISFAASEQNKELHTLHDSLHSRKNIVVTLVVYTWMQTASLLRACIDLVHACRESKFAESFFALSCLLLDETVDSKRNSKSIRHIWVTESGRRWHGWQQLMSHTASTGHTWHWVQGPIPAVSEARLSQHWIPHQNENSCNILTGWQVDRDVNKDLDW